MPRKNTRSKRNSRRGNKRGGPTAQFFGTARRTMSLVSPSIKKAINIYYTTFAVYNASASLGMYSFTSSTGQVSPTLYQDILSDMLNSAEFTVLKGQYNLYKINSVTLKIASSTIMPTNLADAPPLFYDLTVGSNVSYTNTMAAKSDSSIEVKYNSTGDFRFITYVFPPHLTGISGYSIGGSGTWMPTNAAYSNGLLYLIQGYHSNPGFNSTVSSSSYKMANIDVMFDVDFGSASYTQ